MLLITSSAVNAELECKTDTSTSETQNQVDKNMKSRYESSGYKLAIDNIIFRQYKQDVNHDAQRNASLCRQCRYCCLGDYIVPT
jgi:hypothetical protein